MRHNSWKTLLARKVAEGRAVGDREPRYWPHDTACACAYVSLVIKQHAHHPVVQYIMQVTVVVQLDCDATLGPPS